LHASAIVGALLVVVSANAGEMTKTAAGATRNGEVSGPKVDVRSRSDVTVVGRFESLYELIEQLCETSGVVLRTYTAPDRAVVANYRNLPFRDVLQRLLSRESFAIGVTKRPDTERPRVTWIRVVSARASEASVHGPTVLPRAAFSSPHAAVRRRAASAFASRVRHDAEFRAQFLRTADLHY